MRLEDLEVYQQAMELGEKIWEIAINWNYFAKDTIGKQLVRAVDSVASNLSEGFGRFSYKENRQFCFYARGSLYGTRTWLTKGNKRKLITDDAFISLENDIMALGKKMNAYIKSIGKKPKNQITNNQ
ncbi:MAG: four helix bundle protein [Desulfobacteraceae bacterium]|nr:four helix bundle protein [Desulfobacteraceae bacterium]